MEKNNNNYKIINIIMKTILLLPIFTIVQKLPFMMNFNKVLVALVLLELLLSFRNLRYKKIDFVIIFLTIIIHIVAFLYTKFPIYNFNVVFYLLIWVLFYIMCASQKKQILNFFKDNESYILKIVLFWSAIVGVSIVIPSCYSNQGYFISFGDAPFRLMTSTLIITSLIVYICTTRKNKKYNLLFIIPTYCAFMGYSRTYFGIYLIFIVIYFYNTFRHKWKFYMYIIPILAIMIAIIPYTSIGDKIKITTTSTSYQSDAETLTSGRVDFWELDLKHFKRLGFAQRFIGNGYNFVYDVNAIRGRKIWAHNDIINLLMNFGYIGVIIYIYSFCRMYFELKKNNSKFTLFLFLIAVFINSMFNMSYTYICAFISYPIFLISFREENK